MKNQAYYRLKLKEAVEGILSGELNHKQSNWHCGSSHCVCGWYEVLTLEEGYKYVPELEMFESLGKDIYCYSSPRYVKSAPPWSREEWVSYETGYGEDDICELFDSENSKKDIEKIWGRMNEDRK